MGLGVYIMFGSYVLKCIKLTSCAGPYWYKLVVWVLKQYFLFFRHLDFFEMVRSVDEKELSKRFEGVSQFYLYLSSC